MISIKSLFNWAKIISGRMNVHIYLNNILIIPLTYVKYLVGIRSNFKIVLSPNLPYLKL